MKLTQEQINYLEGLKKDYSVICELSVQWKATDGYTLKRLETALDDVINKGKFSIFVERALYVKKAQSLENPHQDNSDNEYNYDFISKLINTIENLDRIDNTEEPWNE